MQGALTPPQVEGLRLVFPEVIKPEYPRVVARLLRRKLSRAEAADLAQEVFLTLFKEMCATGYPDHMRTFVYRITTNKLLTYLRNRGRITSR